MILLGTHTVPSDVLILYTEKIFKVLIWLMGHWDGVGGRGGRDERGMADVLAQRQPPKQGG